MNIGLLTRLKVLVGNPEELINQARNNIRLSPQRGHVESAFYISSTDSSEIFVFSLWLFDYNLDEIRQNVQSLLLRTLNDHVEIISQSVFRLSWDYRLIPYVPVASNLRILTFPKTFSEAQIIQINEDMRERRKTFAGVIGAWAGVDVNDKWVHLYRLDWVSKQVQQEFLYSPEAQQAQIWLDQAGIKTSDGSFSSQSIVQLDSNGSVTNGS